jgi:hypothetical protein
MNEPENADFQEHNPIMSPDIVDEDLRNQINQDYGQAEIFILAKETYTPYLS